MCQAAFNCKTPLVATVQTEHSLWQPKLMYLINNAWTSAQSNFLSIFYQQMAQFTKVQIGFLQTLPCLCTMLAPPFWGVVADRIENQRLIQLSALLRAHCSLSNFQVAPTGSLLDHTVLNLLDKVGGEYGKQRLFGALGYGLGAYVTGLIVAVAGISWSFNVSLGLGLTSLLVLRTIPPMQHSRFLNDAVLEYGAVKPPSLMENVRMITKWGIFLTLNLYNLSGKNAQIVGIAIMCETASELPAFFYSHKIINRFAWAACTQFVYSAASPGCQGTIMGVLNAVQNGLARGMGTLIGGYFYEHYGARTMWLVADLGVPLALIGLGVFAHFKSKKNVVQGTFLEEAELFSPHAGNPQRLKSDMDQTYHEIP
ncbi:unnamed protein product [Peronospora belbahrii]|uniref:Major facilitator superfamily associated domain-containing protein n=1 Tax=Peronospora belbahrii TaxID=622444 RepID=A0AAU9L979_9STRA|nr:unnamed protein product [Peronospora belbahrii]